MNIVRATLDGVFGDGFTVDDRAAWRTFLAAIFAEPLPMLHCMSVARDVMPTVQEWLQKQSGSQ